MQSPKNGANVSVTFTTRLCDGIEVTASKLVHRAIASSPRIEDRIELDKIASARIGRADSGSTMTTIALDYDSEHTAPASPA